MKNFEFDHNGKKLWYSRSVAVAGFVFAADKEHRPCILAVKRGKGAETCKGMWSVPSGYIDFNERCCEACAREIYEETGLSLKKPVMHVGEKLTEWLPMELFSIYDTPKGKKQNIVMNYEIWLMGYWTDEFNLTKEHMEPDEIEDIRWIPLSELDNYNFAYNGKDMIRSVYKKHSSFKAKLRRLLNLDAI